MGHNAAMDQRLTNLEGNFKSLSENITVQFTALNAKMDERGRPQWQLLVGIGSLMLGLTAAIGTLAYQPIKSDLTRLETAMSKVVDNYVTNLQLDQRFTLSDQRRDEWQRESDGRQEQSRQTTHELQLAVVPRSELNEKWDAQRQRDMEIQRQIDENKKSFQDLSPAKDLLGNMQRRIESIEAFLRAK
jgi:hypothetical protein